MPDHVLLAGTPDSAGPPAPVAGQPGQSTETASTTSLADLLGWPSDPVEPTPAETGPAGTGPAEPGPVDPAEATAPVVPASTPAGPGAAAEPDETSLSPVALRILGAQRSSAQLAQLRDVSARKHRVALGDDWVDVVLAEAPAAGQSGRTLGGHTWLARSPYLVWSPLPHDVPAGGAAFVCVGAGEEGCLFIDLGAAPGAVAIGGDRRAASRLAESMVYQLCVGSDPGEDRAVTIVGQALPQPLSAGARWAETLSDLASAAGDHPADDGGTEVVFCELRSNEEAFALARYTNSATHRVVPVILANLPYAPWSLTAVPRHPDGEVHSRVIS
jgi:hypothetical protein